VTESITEPGVPFATPGEYVSRRTTRRIDLAPGESFPLFEARARGRIKHWANDLESVVYYYRNVQGAVEPPPQPLSWDVAGPFECNSHEDFQRAEFPERPREGWPDRVVADFGQYAPQRGGPRQFRPTVTQSEQTWLDLARHFRAPAGRPEHDTGQTEQL
jgi:hypothetical protein